MILFHFAHPSAAAFGGIVGGAAGALFLSRQSSLTPCIGTCLLSLPLPWGPGSLPHHQPLLLFPSEAPQNILTHPLTQVESISVPTYCSRVGCRPQLSPLFAYESVVNTCLCAYVCKWMNVYLCMPGHACICTCKCMCASKPSSPWQPGRRILLPPFHSVCHFLPQALRSRHASSKVLVS